MCSGKGDAPVLFMATRDGVNLFKDGRAQCVQNQLTGFVTDSGLPGGGLATLDVGATPTGLPGSGWVLNAGADSGFRGGIAKAEFTGAGLGVGAEGYFNINSGNGTLSSLVITNPGSGHTGVITARPRVGREKRVVFDLGDDWHQYSFAAVAYWNFPSGSLLRQQVFLSRYSRDRIECMALNPGSNTEAFNGPITGSAPTRSVRVGGRFVIFAIDCGMDLPASADMVLVVYRQ